MAGEHNGTEQHGAEHNGGPDLLVVGGRVVTMDADRRVLDPGAVAVAGDRILAVDAPVALRASWPGTPELDARRGVVTPGMVNGHQHLTGDPLVRGCIPDDLAPGRSIFEWAVPVHGAHTPDDDELTATISAVDSLRNGVTTLVEAGTVAFPERLAAGTVAAGARGTIGTWGWDVDEGPFAAPADEVLDRQRAVLDRFPAGGQVEGWVTLVGHSLASDALLAGAADLARARGTNMTMHLSPTSSDPEVYLERHGRRPVVHLQHLGVLGRHLLLGHGVWLDDAEVDAVLASGTAIAYCPWAYIRLGQGVCGHGRHAEIARRGGRIALGCDASNAGDAPDILRAAALAAGLAKDTRVDPTWFGAHDTFEWATVAGAQAVGMGDRIGSIEPGKLADLVVHDASGPQWAPDADVALQLVWGTDGRTVRDVLVGGQVVVRDGRSTRVDEAALHDEAVAASRAILARAGIEVPHRWPVVRGGAPFLSHVPADAHEKGQSL
jgi:5-methylthioadenosine/S-adenosylhomocysteine deaminase